MRPGVLIPNLSAALVIAFLNVASALVMGVLVFSGPLAPYQSLGIGMFLVSTLIGGFLLPVTSGYKAMIGSPRSAQAPVFVAIATSVTLTMQGAPLENIAVTVMVILLLSTTLIGALMYAVGALRIAGVVRYIPYPVMGGTFAGLGFLLAQGGVLVAVAPFADLNNLPGFLSATALLHLAPALVFALLLFTIERKIKHWSIVPGLITIAVLGFHAVLYANGQTLQDATGAHWLPKSTSIDPFLPVIVPSQLQLVDWSTVLSQASAMAVLAFLSVIMILLDVSGIEIIINRDLDPNHEIKAAGLGNVLGGLAGGPLSFHSSMDSAMSTKLGGTDFLMVLFYTAFVALVIWIGPAPLALIPSFMTGGFLIFVGLSFLEKWVWSARKKLPVSEMLVVFCILVFIVKFGILEGVLVGIGLATALFVHRYSRLSVIKSQMSGADYLGTIDRSLMDQAHLSRHSAGLQIFLLQGFLFFGSASRILERVKQVLSQPGSPRIRYLVMDFTHVDGMDSSATNSVSRLLQWSKRDGFHLILTCCQPDVSAQLKQLARDTAVHDLKLHFFSDLDDGIGWCQDQILLSNTPDDGTTDTAENDFKTILRDLLGDATAAEQLAPAFQHTPLPAGQYLFRQNDAGDALYLIHSGSVAVDLELPDGNKRTVRTMRAGAVFGEMALYTGERRSASVRASHDCLLYRLDRADFDQLQRDHPHAFGLFHSFVVRVIAERLERANRSIMALSR